jgi:uncharacterized protein YciI
MNRWNFLVILRPLRPEMLTEGPTPEETACVSAHFQYYSALVASEQALLVGRTQENTAETLGLAIISAPDITGARKMAEADPAVANGVMSVDVRSYTIALLGETR